MAEGRREIPTVLVGLLWVASLAHCFNLEPQIAKIYANPYATETQEREAYFGYAVALQHDDEQDSNWVIVGAPRANSTYHDKTVITEPGALFKCPLTSDSCEELLVDPTGNEVARFGRPELYYKDLKNYGWLGGSLDSQPRYQNNRQATCVCAPQWKDQKWRKNTYMNGACHISFDTFSNDTYFKKKVPLVNRNKQTQGNKMVYGYGQAGFSVHFPDDSTKMVIGLPGVYDWKGSVLLFADENEESIEPVRKKREADDHDHMFHFDSEVKKSDEFETSSLFGYSVTSGKLLDINKTHYAAGGPRAANSLGKVIIFEFPSNGEQKLVIKRSLRGMQIGEYFGAALTAADINGDGLDDLVVGSPMYSDSNLKNPDRGRIQSFLSTKGGYARPKSHCGYEVALARFGTSLASPGDLNADGYEDIVVGAPWEGDGAVYIFLGSQSGLRDRWSQRLSPEDFTPTVLKGFGLSVSRGIDIDKNDYSDLAIGSFLSGHVVVVKSRPVATLYGKINLSQSSVNWEEKAVINVKTCLKYEGFSIPENLSVRAKLILDNTMYRAVFDSKLSTESFEEQLVINKDKCKTHQVIVKEEKINPDIPISLRLEYGLVEDSTLELAKRPMTDPAAHNYTSTNVAIVKDCNDKICRVNLKAMAEFTNGVRNAVVIGKLNKLRVTVSNSGEPAYVPNMTVTADRYFELIPPVSHEDCLVDVTDTKVFLRCQLSNPIKNNSSPDVLEVGVKVNEKQLMRNISQFVLHVNVLGEGKEEEPGDNFIDMDPQLATEASLELHGASEDEQAPYRLSDDKKSIMTKNVKFNHTYVLIKKGPTALTLIDLTIKIPVNFTNGLNFVKVYGWTEYSKLFTFNCKLEGIKKATRSSSMNHGDGVAMTSGSSDIHGASSEKESDAGVQYFNCSSNLIKCAKLYCPTHDWVLDTQSAKVSVELDVDLSVLAKHISVKDGTIFGSMAVATIQSLKSQVLHIGNRTITGEVVTYIQPDTLLSNGIPWWVILLAVLGSLLLLGIMAYVLYEKGFFKREQMEEMMAHRARIESSSQGGTVNTSEIHD